MSWSPLFMVTLRQATRIRSQAREIHRLEKSYRTAVACNHDLQTVCDGWRLRCELLLEMVPNQADALSMLRTMQTVDELPTTKGPRAAP